MVSWQRHVHDFQKGINYAKKHGKSIKRSGRIVGGWLSDYKKGDKHTPPSLTGPSVHRRSSIASSGGSRRMSIDTSGHGSYRSAASGVSADIPRLPTKRFKRGNANRVVGIKRVKVPSKLRLQIKEIDEAQHIQGYMQENYICTQNSVAPTTNLTNVIENISIPNDSLGSYFSWNHILHCASRLWNQKVANTFPNVTDALNFDPLNTQVHVRKQWVTLRFKNNSTRSVRMKIINATPHGTKTIQTPVAAWISGLNDMVTSGRMIVNNSNGISQLYVHPKVYDGFKNQYGTSEVDYVLEPGQSVEQNIRGPAMIYDGGKFYNNGAYNVFQKQDIFQFAVITSDTISDNVGVTGHLGDNTTLLASNFLLCEGTYHVHMSMPEPTGWTSGGVAPAAGPVKNNNRVKRFVFDEFNSTTATGASTEYRTDELQPLG
nr:MAG: capsid protein [Cressdnaviricota sp.]